MSNDDNSLASALSLVVGGAAGYAAGRWLVDPWLATRPTMLHASSSTTRAASPAPRRPAPARALGVGPSGAMQPIDPYGPPVTEVVATPYAGPSGDMRPIDPYADATPSIAPATIVIGPSAPMPADGPITRPPELPIVATPITSQPDHEAARRSRSSHRRSRTVRSRGPRRSNHPPERADGAGEAGEAECSTEHRVRDVSRACVASIRCFAAYRGSLPIEYVRALVERESDGDPAVRTGSAIGLMQIVPVVLADYNKRHGTAYRSEHLTDPASTSRSAASCSA